MSPMDVIKCEVGQLYATHFHYIPHSQHIQAILWFCMYKFVHNKEQPKCWPMVNPWIHLSLQKFRLINPIGSDGDNSYLSRQLNSDSWVGL